MGIFYLIIIIIAFGIFFIIGSIVIIFWLSSFAGAPYLPTDKKNIKRMLDLAELKKGDKLYDLGSGDGRILIIASQDYQATAVGIELNPIMVYRSRLKVKKNKLHKRVKVFWGNIFSSDISDADVVIIFLLQITNNLLEKKLLRELKSGTRVVSRAFTFSTIPLVRTHPCNNSLRLYRIP